MEHAQRENIFTIHPKLAAALKQHGAAEFTSWAAQATRELHTSLLD
jgi:hypothetical protein